MPEPDRDAGSRTMMAFMCALLDAGMIVKFWPHNLAYMPSYTEALQDLGIEVFHGRNHPSLRDWLMVNGGTLDLVLLSRPDVAIDCLPIVKTHTQARIAYYGHDLHFRRMRQQGEFARDEAMLRAADRIEEVEREVWCQVGTVLYPSEEEAGMVAALEPTVQARAVVPYCFEQFGLRIAVPTGPTLLFVGGFGHPPNADAACWFAAHVLPIIRDRVPDVRLAIVGSNPTERVCALARGHIEIHADVSDDELNAWYRRARVAVVPLLAGAGVKLKVIEAVVYGLPVVTTPVGAQGLPGIDDVIAVTRDADGFADAVRRILEDDAEWLHRSAIQIDYVRQRFSVAALRQSLLAGLPIRQPELQRIAT